MDVQAKNKNYFPALQSLKKVIAHLLNLFNFSLYSSCFNMDFILQQEAILQQLASFKSKMNDLFGIPSSWKTL